MLKTQRKRRVYVAPQKSQIPFATSAASPLSLLPPCGRRAMVVMRTTCGSNSPLECRTFISRLILKHLASSRYIKGRVNPKWTLKGPYKNAGRIRQWHVIYGKMESCLHGSGALILSNMHRKWMPSRRNLFAICQTIWRSNLHIKRLFKTYEIRFTIFSEIFRKGQGSRVTVSPSWSNGNNFDRQQTRCHHHSSIIQKWILAVLLTSKKFCSSIHL